MANRAAPALVLRPGDREELERWTRSSTVEASAAKRARTVLLAADGVANTRIAEMSDATVTTVLAWRERYMIHGLAGLSDWARSGRPRQLDHAHIVAATGQLVNGVDHVASTSQYRSRLAKMLDGTATFKPRGGRRQPIVLSDADRAAAQGLVRAIGDAHPGTYEGNLGSYGVSC